MKSNSSNSMTVTQGFALPLALSLIALMLILFATYSIVTVQGIKTSAGSANSSAGFYAAEAALNSRAEKVRSTFQGFRVPQGTSPSGTSPCTGTNMGDGDYACQNVAVGGRTTVSYVKQDAAQTIRIPAGEDFEGLNAEETPFTVYGRALNAQGNPEAISTLVLRSRVVPLFQFAVFFDKDLEFDNTANMTLSGPVHTNGYMFLDAGGTLNLTGQITSAEQIYRGKKQTATCTSGPVNATNAAGSTQVVPASGCRYQLTGSALNVFGGKIKDNLGTLTVPSVAVLQPKIGETYWDKADVRIVLKRTGSYSASTWTPRFVKADGTVLSVTCSAGVGTSNNFLDNREAQIWTGASSSRANRRMLDIDVRNLLTCMQANRSTFNLSGLDDQTEGGLVIYATVDDSSDSTITSGLLRPTLGAAGNNISQTDPPVANNYAIRLYNGALLNSNTTSDPKPKGIAFVSDQATFIEGNFNSAANKAAGWIPAAVLADSVNVLSANWRTQEICRDSDNYYRNTNPYAGGNMASNNGYYWTNVITVNGTKWYRFSTTAVSSGYVASPTSSNPDVKSSLPLFCRTPTATTIKAAILAGSATTGTNSDIDNGTADHKTYTSVDVTSGGVHNLTRFHEDWGSGTVDFTYRGSLVSLAMPLHARGPFQLGQNIYYHPPQRLWSFEEYFRDSADLPPLSPRFIYLKQDNFTRQFEQ